MNSKQKEVLKVLEETEEIWLLIAEGIEKDDAADIVKDSRNLNDYYFNDCPCCEYTADKDYYLHCNKCPIGERMLASAGINKKDILLDEDCYCETSAGELNFTAYERWCDSHSIESVQEMLDIIQQSICDIMNDEN